MINSYFIGRIGKDGAKVIAQIIANAIKDANIAGLSNYVK